MSKEMMLRSNIARLLDLDRRTVGKYIERAHIDGYPEGTQRAKYNVYEVAALFGYTKSDVQQLMKEAQ